MNSQQRAKQVLKEMKEIQTSAPSQAGHDCTVTIAFKGDVFLERNWNAIVSVLEAASEYQPTQQAA